MSAILFRCLSVFAVLGLIAGGCESMHSSEAANASAPQRAVVLTGAHGSGTIVVMQSSDPEHPTMLTSGAMPDCPTCRAAVTDYFKTGKIDPTCPDCGATRTVVMLPVRPAIGHQ